MLDRDEPNFLPQDPSGFRREMPLDASSASTSGGKASRSSIGDEDLQEWILPSLTDCYFLTGPTASGKTQLAIELARRLDAEILSLDSMAVYRHMDIGTAKPTAEQRALVPHHLLDLVDPTQSYSVSSYVSEAHRVAASLRAKGKKILVCGGTPLYLKSLLRGLFLGPPADWDFRNAVEQDLKQYGGNALRERLAQVDPLAAHKLHPNDHRRMVRALEVARFTGKPLSHWQQQFDLPASPSVAPAAVLGIDRSWLHERINARVESMLEAGLIEETRGLLDRYGHIGRTAAQAVGYREVLAHVQQGVSLAETLNTIQARTRQFARRQEIWFRSLEELQRVEVTAGHTTCDLADQVVKIFNQYRPPDHHA
jgi:tRNA dimethylallyltransferase